MQQTNRLYPIFVFNTLTKVKIENRKFLCRQTIASQKAKQYKPYNAIDKNI
jgi:hypothetical protein